MTDQARVLVVEDEKAHADALVEALETEGYTLEQAHSGEEGLTRLRSDQPHVVVTDLKLGGEVDGLEVVRAVANLDRQCEVILITAHSSIDTCKQALREGAYDYIEKPIDLDLLRAAVKRGVEKVLQVRENRRLQERLDEKFGFEGVVGQSSAMLTVVGIAMNESTTAPTSAVCPVGRLNSSFTKGATISNPTKPSTTLGMAARSSTPVLRYSFARGGATSAMYTAAATPSGIESSAAPMVTTSVPQISERMPNWGGLEMGCQSLPPINSSGPTVLKTPAPSFTRKANISTTNRMQARPLRSMSFSTTNSHTTSNHGRRCMGYTSE